MYSSPEVSPANYDGDASSPRNQNDTFTANCMSRGAELDEMIPISLVPTVADGSPKLGWLNALKSSPRNSVVILVPILARFMKARSQFCVPGPIRMFRREVPKRGFPLAKACSRADVVKQAVLNHSAIVCGPVPLQMRSGRGD